MPTDWKYPVDKVTKSIFYLTLLFMTAKMIELAADIVDFNPVGSQFIVDLTNAETGIDIMKAIEHYDSALLNYNTYNSEYEDETEEVEVLV